MKFSGFLEKPGITVLYDTKNNRENIEDVEWIKGMRERGGERIVQRCTHISKPLLAHSISTW